MGLLPLLSTISSYMILTSDIENDHETDKNLFIYSRDEDVFKARKIRNSCIDLISKLIEDFQDESISQLIFIVQNLFLTKDKKQSSPSKINVQSEQQQTSIEEVNVYEFSYSSSNPNHFWKKREVALVLIA
jgi:hypothetical protein